MRVAQSKRERRTSAAGFRESPAASVSIVPHAAPALVGMQTSPPRRLPVLADRVARSVGECADWHATGLGHKGEHRSSVRLVRELVPA
jgi:hypothetical protein